MIETKPRSDADVMIVNRSCRPTETRPRRSLGLLRDTTTNAEDAGRPRTPAASIGVITTVQCPGPGTVPTSVLALVAPDTGQRPSAHTAHCALANGAGPPALDWNATSKRRDVERAAGP